MSRLAPRHGDGEREIRGAMVICVVAASLWLAACSGPSLVQNPESGIELRWANGRGSIDEARVKAERRCSAEQKRAILTTEFMDGDETLARFRCA